MGENSIRQHIIKIHHGLDIILNKLDVEIVSARLINIPVFSLTVLSLPLLISALLFAGGFSQSVLSELVFSWICET